MSTGLSHTLSHQFGDTGTNRADGTDESDYYTDFLDGTDDVDSCDRFPKPCVACSIHAGGAFSLVRALRVWSWRFQFRLSHTLEVELGPEERLVDDSVDFGQLGGLLAGQFQPQPELLDALRMSVPQHALGCTRSYQEHDDNGNRPQHDTTQAHAPSNAKERYANGDKWNGQRHNRDEVADAITVLDIQRVAFSPSVVGHAPNNSRSHLAIAIADRQRSHSTATRIGSVSTFGNVTRGSERERPGPTIWIGSAEDSHATRFNSLRAASPARWWALETGAMGRPKHWLQFLLCIWSNDRLPPLHPRPGDRSPNDAAARVQSQRIGLSSGSMPIQGTGLSNGSIAPAVLLVVPRTASVSIPAIMARIELRKLFDMVVTPDRCVVLSLSRPPNTTLRYEST